MAEGSSYKSETGGVRMSLAANKGGKSTDITAGIIDFRYFESILSDTISIQVTFIDTGGSTGGQSVLDGLPIVGGERCFFAITDSNDISIENVPLFVDTVSPVSDDNRGQIVTLNLKSKEYFINDKIRLSKKFSGKISESVATILSNSEFGLGTDKVLVDIEDTINNFNFLGNMKKPFYTINWLAKKGVPSESSALGKSAGFFFWETSEGYNFKSIDAMMDKNKNEPKRSIIYNNTSDELGAQTPSRYTTKALEFSSDVPINAAARQKVGANATKMVLFDPFNCFYEVVYNNSFENKDGYTSSGEELLPVQPEFDTPASRRDFSRTTYYLLDKGTLPDGGTEQQLEKSKEENFEYSKILNQSIMRYNQFFGYKVEVTIPGDFELHAGDMIFVDSAEKKDTTSGDVNQNSGGLYIISELCHFLSTKGTYTRLNLVRDSVGRSGRPNA